MIMGNLRQGDAPLKGRRNQARDHREKRSWLSSRRYSAVIVTKRCTSTPPELEVTMNV